MFTKYTAWERYLTSNLIPILLGLILGATILGLSSFPIRVAALMVGGIVLVFTAIISGKAKKVFLFLLLINIALVLDVNLGNDPTIFENPNGFNISITNIMLVALYVTWFIEIATVRNTKINLFPSVTVPTLGLILAGLVSVLNAKSKIFSFYEIKFLIECLLIYLYIANNIKSTDDMKMIINTLLVGLIIVSLVVLLQSLTRIQFNLLFTDVPSPAAGDGIFRPDGTVGSPNVTGGFLSALLLINLGFLISKNKVINQTFAWWSFSLGLLALVATLSRGSWLAFTSAFLVLLVVSNRKKLLRIPPITIIVGTVIIIIIASVFGTAVVIRSTQNFEPIFSRIPLIQLSLNMVQEHPLIGVGLNNYGLVINDYTTAELSGQWLFTVHNKYLAVWAETGTLGLLFFIWLLAAVFHNAIQLLRFNNPPFLALSVGVFAALVSYTIHMIGEIYDATQIMYLFWVLIGLITGSLAFLRSEENKVKSSVNKR
jgi:putative inorganic carbon (HCO3(-)) transporter